MGKFVTTEVPAWRIVFWGVVAALAVLALGYFSFDHIDSRFFIVATCVGALFSGFGFFLLWSLRSGWAARHLKLLFVIYIIGQTGLMVWAILDPQ